TVEADSLEEWTDLFMAKFPPMVRARELLGERFGELRAAVVGVWERADEGRNGRFRLPQEYLLAVVSL
ncbi:MAG TPA: hypothetical protein VM266_11385, partial [Solirubrobacteraceae bacterium]|nr:hypothetical protein [Solirubrobacteraceae bacterium]